MSRCDNGLAGSARKVNLSGGTRHLINSRPTMEEPFVVSRESYLPRLALSASNFRTHAKRIPLPRYKKEEHLFIELFYCISALLFSYICSIFDISKKK